MTNTIECFVDVKQSTFHSCCSTQCFSPVLFNLFCYSAPSKIFWRTHAPYLLKHL